MFFSSKSQKTAVQKATRTRAVSDAVEESFTNSKPLTVDDIFKTSIIDFYSEA